MVGGSKRFPEDCPKDYRISASMEGVALQSEQTSKKKAEPCLTLPYWFTEKEDTT